MLPGEQITSLSRSPSRPPGHFTGLALRAAVSMPVFGETGNMHHFRIKWRRKWQLRDNNVIFQGGEAGADLAVW